MQDNDSLTPPVPVEELAPLAPSAPPVDVKGPETPVSAELSAIDAFTLDEALTPSVVPSVPEATADSSAVKEEVDEPVTVFEATPNATHQYSTKGTKDSGSPDTIAIPPGTEKLVRGRLNQVPNVDIMLSGQQKRWGETLREGLTLLPMDGVYNDRLATPGATFTQSVYYGGNELRGQAPSFKSTPGTKEVEGERAILQLLTHMGVGGLFRAPLWNSGLWVMFKPSTESELLELNRMIYADKISLGRWSYGLALSNSVVYTLDRVFEFALRHVYSTSIKAEELPIEKLRDHIAPQDISSFIWGFLCANYPSGFHYTSGCINTRRSATTWSKRP